MSEKITYEWLRSRGFRVEIPVVYVPHMAIELDMRTETLLELAPHNFPNSPNWYCWFRNDMAHRRSRFNWVRTISYTSQVENLYRAITDHDLVVVARTEQQINELQTILEREWREALDRWHRQDKEREHLLMRAI